MEISFHGACREVGRAAYVVSDGKKRVLLDYGVKIDDSITLPMPVQGLLDGVIVSHAHLDHCGALPLLYRTSETLSYMTPPSLPMVDLLVKDSIKVNKLKGFAPIFSSTHLKRLLRNVIPVDYGKKRTLTNGWQFEFRDAGHILGAAVTKLWTDKCTLAYSGDFKLEETQLHKGADWPWKADVLIIEGTYGNSEHPDRAELEKKFAEECESVLDSGGNVLVPAFAVGRAQEILSILYENKFDYPVYLDGMGKEASEIMLDFPDYIKNFNELYKALNNSVWVKHQGMRKKALEEPSVIVSTAGMLQGGPAVWYLFKMREMKDSAVFFSGYQPEQTAGYRLLEEKRFKYEDYDLNYSGMNIQHFDFSAHAGMKDLHEVVKRTDPKAVIVIHGEGEKAQALADWAQQELGIYSFVPKFGQTIKIDEYL